MEIRRSAPQPLGHSQPAFRAEAWPRRAVRLDSHLYIGDHRSHAACRHATSLMYRCTLLMHTVDTQYSIHIHYTVYNVEITLSTHDTLPKAIAVLIANIYLKKTNKLKAWGRTAPLAASNGALRLVGLAARVQSLGRHESCSASQPHMAFSHRSRRVHVVWRLWEGASSERKSMQKPTPADSVDVISPIVFN